jgi:hypothetical protein
VAVNRPPVRSDGVLERVRCSADRVLPESGGHERLAQIHR